MKKIVFLASIMLLFVSCGSDDDGATGVNVSPSFTADVNAIEALPPGSTDISTLVDFGQGFGNSAADFTTDVELNDTFILDTPNGLSSGDEFLYTNVFFFDEFDEEILATEEGDIIIGEKLQLILPPGVTGTTIQEYYYEGDLAFPQVAFKVIDVDAQDLTWKYDIECVIIRNGVELGIYTIDPRLKLKSRTN